jgi:hypothetical protein
LKTHLALGKAHRVPKLLDTPAKALV